MVKQEKLSCTLHLHYNPFYLQMVRDAYYFAFPLLLAAALIGWLAGIVWVLPLVFLEAFFLWFFRDPERVIPDDAGALVSPADGKVTDIAPAISSDGPRLRVSIFLNVFDVHVNRSPIGGIIRKLTSRIG